MYSIPSVHVQNIESESPDFGLFPKEKKVKIM